MARYIYILYLHPTVQGVTEVEEVREVAGRHTSKLLLVDLHQPGLRMTDSASGATLDKVRRWVPGQWQHCSRVIMGPQAAAELLRAGGARPGGAGAGDHHPP